MNKKALEQFKNQLLEERADLENELSGVGRKSSTNTGGWEATSGTMEVDSADENEVADKLEELEENTGIVNSLEKQLNEVNAALARIEKGTYGVCEECGKPMDIGRLEANPSARSSVKHPH